MRAEFVETQPDVFRGPNPWVQLERPPGRVLEGSLAMVYAEGSQTRWVELLMEGPHHEWFQTVNYFYGVDNRLVKRERFLDQVPANTALEELLYYENGQIFSRASHHHPLKAGREDTSQFNDPNAPEFGSVDELPFPADSDAERPLASTPAEQGLGQHRPESPGLPRVRCRLQLEGENLGAGGRTAAQGLVEIPNQIFHIF